MEKTVEENYFDECGNEIKDGDLLRVWHFRERYRRKIHYMYQIAVLQEWPEGFYWYAKSYHVPENKGHYRLKAVADKETRIIHGTVVVDMKGFQEGRNLKQTPIKQ